MRSRQFWRGSWLDKGSAFSKSLQTLPPSWQGPLACSLTHLHVIGGEDAQAAMVLSLPAEFLSTSLWM